MQFISNEVNEVSEIVYLAWAGTPTSVTLHMEIGGAFRPHKVYLNDDGTYVNEVGTVPIDLAGQPNCGGNQTPTFWDNIDPSWLKQGYNEITIVNDYSQTWHADQAYLEVQGADLQGTELVTFDFTSSYDAEVLEATLQVPPGWVGGPTPVLIGLHGWLGFGHHYLEDVIPMFAGPAAQRGWLLLAPQTHGEQDPRPGYPQGHRSLASRAAQHDVFDSLAYVDANYGVDPSRVYLAGQSMGGMNALTTAAKYPDQFAAVLSDAGITDLPDWVRRV
jgi:hypothetical protein